MKRNLMNILWCPMCKGDLVLEVTEENEKEIVKGALHCEKCNVYYPIDDGIPNMLPPDLTFFTKETSSESEEIA